jgi:hypothetical protein
MNHKIKWTILAGCLVLLLLLSLFLPMAADAWTETRTVGELSYEKLEYEPYEVSYYPTFADKLSAIAGSMTNHASSSVITLEEGSEAVDDEMLLQLANKELSLLHENGLLPKTYEVQEWTERKLMELYVLPQSKEETSLPDVCFWYLSAVQDDVRLTICMDTSFYKIYCFSFQQEETELTLELEEWQGGIGQTDGKTLAEGWYNYWGLETGEIVDAYDEENAADLPYTYAVSMVDAGMVNRYYVALEDGNYLELSYRMTDYTEYGLDGVCQLITGMQGILIQFGYT